MADKETYYEVEGAVFRAAGNKLEVYSEKTKAFKPYEGDADRVYRLSNPMTLEEVQPYMAGRQETTDQAEKETETA